MKFINPITKMALCM